jgi:hypothetical protein
MKRLFTILILLAGLGAVIMVARSRRSGGSDWGEEDWSRAYGDGLSVAAGDVRATAGTTATP